MNRKQNKGIKQNTRAAIPRNISTPNSTEAPSTALERSLVGSMLGTAIGDALGLACEGLSPQRQLKIFPSLDRYGFLFGIGMISDDTEHTVMLAQSLIVSGGHEERFAHNFAWRLRGWLAALPAGVGMATGRAILKLWMCFPPSHSGVKSAGNGPAMRAAVLGVVFGNDMDALRRLNRISARITHKDDKAEEGALTVAIAAHLSATCASALSANEFATIMSKLLPMRSATLAAIEAVAASLEAQESATDFMDGIGCKNGVSGYMLHTLPAVLHVWLRHQDDYIGGVKEMIRLGGDSDSTAAILGGIIGARVGRSGIPATYLRNLREWPRSPRFIARVAQRLAQSRFSNNPVQAVPSVFLVIPLRNLLFLGIVLIHGLRRLLPPY